MRNGNNNNNNYTYLKTAYLQVLCVCVCVFGCVFALTQIVTPCKWSMTIFFAARSSDKTNWITSSCRFKKQRKTCINNNNNNANIYIHIIISNIKECRKQFYTDIYLCICVCAYAYIYYKYIYISIENCIHMWSPTKWLIELQKG